MSAGFEIDDAVFWGSNGSIEVYLQSLAAQSASRFGQNDPLTVFFEQELNGFYSGTIVPLDAQLADVGSRTRFVEALDAATEQLLREGAFTESGREWVATVMVKLQACIDVRRL